MKPDEDTGKAPQGKPGLVRELVIASREQPGALTTAMKGIVDGANLARRELRHRVRPDLGAVRALALSRDGRRLGVAAGRFASCWDLSKNECLMVFGGHQAATTSVALSPGGRSLASGSEDGTAVIGEIASGRIVQTCKHPGPVNSVFFLDDSQLVTASGTHSRIWDIGSGACVTALQHSDNVRVVFATRDRRWLATEGADSAEVWDLVTKERHRILYHGITTRPALYLDTLGGFLMSSHAGTRAFIWDVDTGQLLRVFEHDRAVRSNYITSDGRRIVTAAEDYRAWLFDVESGDRLMTFSGHQDWVNSAVISEDGARVVTGSEDQTVKLWSAGSGECLHTLGGFSSAIVGASLTPDNTGLWVAGYDGVARLYSLESGQILKALRGHALWVCALSIDASGDLVATGGRDRVAKVWQAHTGRLIGTYEGQTDVIHGIALNPEGSLLVTGSRDGAARLFDVQSARCLHTYEAHPGWIRAVRFSADGEQFFTAGADGTVKQWGLDGGLIRTYCGHLGNVYSVSVSRDGKRIATGSTDQTARVWEMDGRCIQRFSGHAHDVRAVFLTPDGKRLVTGSLDNTAALWDVETGKRLIRFKDGHTDWIRFVSLTGDGRRVITAGKDQTVCFWNAESGELLGRLHHLKEGFLWTTPPEEHAPSGWIWTNRSDLIDVTTISDTEAGGDEGGATQLTDISEADRKAYLVAHNSRDRVMSRINSPSAKVNDALGRLGELHAGIRNLGAQVKRLPGPNAG